MGRIFITLAVVLLSSLVTTRSHAQCKAKQIAKDCKSNLKPFKYDSYAVSELTFSDKPQTVEVEFSAFAGQKYKLVFCTSGFEEMVTLNIYDRNMKTKKRNKIFDNDNGIDNNFWSFEPPKSGTYYINYEVPPSKDGKVHKGCVVMLIGYQ